LRASLTSKILIPSHDSLIVGDWLTLLQELLLRDESVLRKSSPWETLMSFWLPGQETWLISVGLAGSAMS
jgi:hypothetical protein